MRVKISGHVEDPNTPPRVMARHRLQPSISEGTCETCGKHGMVIWDAIEKNLCVKCLQQVRSDASHIRKLEDEDKARRERQRFTLDQRVAIIQFLREYPDLTFRAVANVWDLCPWSCFRCMWEQNENQDRPRQFPDDWKSILEARPEWNLDE